MAAGTKTKKKKSTERTPSQTSDGSGHDQGGAAPTSAGSQPPKDQSVLTAPFPGAAQSHALGLFKAAEHALREFEDEIVPIRVLEVGYKTNKRGEILELIEVRAEMDDQEERFVPAEDFQGQVHSHAVGIAKQISRRYRATAIRCEYVPVVREEGAEEVRSVTLQRLIVTT